MKRRNPGTSARATSTTPIAATQSNGYRPPEWHADLGLVDDDHTPDMRQGTAS